MWPSFYRATQLSYSPPGHAIANRAHHAPLHAVTVTPGSGDELVSSQDWTQLFLLSYAGTDSSPPPRILDDNNEDEFVSACFREELEMLKKHDAGFSALDNGVLFTLRAVDSDVLHREGDVVSTVHLKCTGIVYLRDAHLAMQRFGEGTVYASQSGKRNEYSGLFLSGLCRFAGSKNGVGKQLVNYCIAHARSLKKKLFLAVFHTDKSDKLLQYYRGLGFLSEAVYRHTKAHIAYTIMVMNPLV